MDYVGVTEIPKKHILKQWMRDARNLLPEHLRHCVTRLLEKKFTKRHSSLYIQAMELVRLGDTSAAASDKLAVLFKENLATMAPFEETRDGLGLEDRPSTRAPCEGCSKRTRFCSICKKPSHK
jgi:hypothetical protein